ncbi:MAG: pyridoxamine 5'-phosphate oxidase family protein [Candidatus Omnitrophica bacterium]|nr:pyridoxamine 5'-phosphate oxidase family protein [Candidatus Omnitrophota bacterium]
MEIPDDIRHFLERQHFVIVSSLGERGSIRTAAKDIVEIGTNGKILLLDLYKEGTYRNIKRSPHITLTAIDERKFKGYSLVGKARIVKEDVVSARLMKLWHQKLAKRIAKRLIRHVKEEVSEHETIPEAKFPFPKYLIEVSVDNIINLAPDRKDRK